MTTISDRLLRPRRRSRRPRPPWHVRGDSAGRDVARQPVPRALTKDQLLRVMEDLELESQ
jgi:hypothetical protein